MALIPWTCDFHRLPVPLEESPRGIQLHVAERNVDDENINQNGDNHSTNSASTSNSNGRKRKEAEEDFVILIIDRTNRESLNYASKWMDNNILKYQREEDSSSSSKSRSVPSICILLNHYDKVKAPSSTEEEVNSKEGDDGINKKDSSIIMMKEIHDMVEEKKKKASQLHKSSLQIRCFDSCMINGYGLEALNSFITLPYLKKREKELLIELDRVKEGLNGFDDKMNQENFVTFESIQEEFLKNAPTHSTAVDKNVESQYDNSARQEDSATINPSSSAIPRPSSDGSRSNEHGNNQEGDQAAAIEVNPQRGRRKIMPTAGNVEERTGMNQNNASSSEEMSSTKLDNSTIQTQSDRGRRRRGRGRASDDWKDAVRPSSPQEVAESKSNNSKSRDEKKTHKKKGKKSGRKTKPKPARYMDPKQALEAFLASDDDDSTDEGGVTNAYPSRYTGGVVSTRQSSRNAAVLDSDSDDSSDDSDSPFGHIRVNRINAVSETLVKNEPSLPDQNVKDKENSSVEEGHESDGVSGAEGDSTAGVILEQKGESSADETSSEGLAASTSDVERDSIHTEYCKEEEIDPEKSGKTLDIEESENVQEDLDRGSCGKVVTARDSEASSEPCKRKVESSAEEYQPLDKSEIISTVSGGREASTSKIDEDSMHSDRDEEELYENEQKNHEKPEDELDGVDKDVDDSCENVVVSAESKTDVNDTCERRSQVSDMNTESDVESESKGKDQDAADTQMNQNVIVDVIDNDSVHTQVQETQNDSKKKEMNTRSCEEESNSDDDSQQGSNSIMEEEAASDTKHQPANSPDMIQRNELADVVVRSEDGDEAIHRTEKVEKGLESLDSDNIESSGKAEIAGDYDSSATKSVPLSGVVDTEVSKENDSVVQKGLKSRANDNIVDHSDYDSDDSSGLIIVDAPKQSSSLQPLNRTVLKRSRVKESQKDMTDGKELSEEQSQQGSAISKEVLDAIAAAQKEAMNLVSNQQKKDKKSKKKSSKKDKKSDSEKKRKKKRS